MTSMMYVYLIAGIIVISAIYLARRYSKIRERRESLEIDWGAPVIKKRNFEMIRLYHDATLNDNESSQVIDEDTWQDLGLDRLFSDADRTMSPTGQQILFDLLHRPDFDVHKLDERESLMDEIEENTELRTNIRYSLLDMDDDKVGYLPHLFMDTLEKPPPYRWLFWVPAFMVLASVIGGLFQPQFFFGIPFVFIMNMAIRYTYSGRFRFMTAPLLGLSRLIQTGKKLSKKIAGIDKLTPYSTRINSSLSSLSKLAKRIQSLAAFQSGGSSEDILAMFYEYLDILFLFEINIYYLLIGQLRNSREEIRQLYETIGELDAMQSATSYRLSIPHRVKPKWIDNKHYMAYKAVYHPLIEDPVANDIRIDRFNLLVTGSNMAGKSTFLKTLGINQVLAQTLNFCCADEARIGMFQVISNMRREDDLSTGKSYYLVEVERIRELLGHSRQPTPHMILIDEIFRGTNTIERVAASCQVLRYLNEGNGIVVASTHDLELVDLLDGHYAFYHFHEIVTDQHLDFDYKIQKGPGSSRNALAILRLLKYPESIVDQAVDLADRLEAHKNNNGTIALDN